MNSSATSWTPSGVPSLCASSPGPSAAPSSSPSHSRNRATAPTPLAMDTRSPDGSPGGPSWWKGIPSGQVARRRMEAELEWMRCSAASLDACRERRGLPCPIDGLLSSNDGVAAAADSTPAARCRIPSTQSMPSSWSAAASKLMCSTCVRSILVAMRMLALLALTSRSSSHTASSRSYDTACASRLCSTPYASRSASVSPCRAGKRVAYSLLSRAFSSSAAFSRRSSSISARASSSSRCPICTSSWRRLPSACAPSSSPRAPAISPRSSSVSRSITSHSSATNASLSAHRTSHCASAAAVETSRSSLAASPR
mmetsp:Transcript_13900/g.44057  ORF Transcript_13900/g.44057 Transcript_13900/m.44057 type:complete len:312 (-) Transcript_13900:1124-2059(-)